MFSKKGNKEALVGGKGVIREDRSEVSQTTNVCTDEQEELGCNNTNKLIRHI